MKTSTQITSRRDVATLLLIGAAAGVMSGLLGVGGGIVMIPLMTALLGLTQHKAHGTSLAVIVFTAVSGALTYGWKGHTDLFVATELAIGSIIGARIGALTMNRIPARQLRMLFGGFIFLVGLRMIVPMPQSLAAIDVRTFAGFVIIVILGLITGFLSGIMGVGGGIVMVPAMVLLLGMAQQDAQGISLLVIIPTSIVGATTHLRKGNVVAHIVPWIALTSIVAAVVGSSLALGPLKSILQQIFGVFLLVVSVQMISTARRQPAQTVTAAK